MNRKGISHQRLRHCAFSNDEDANLRQLVGQLGTSAWQDIALHMTRRSARQCHERWQLLEVRRKSQREFTPEEDRLLVEKCMEIGPKWHVLEKIFDDRTSVCLKNRWLQLSQRAETDAMFSWKPEEHFQAIEKNELLDLFGVENDDEIWEMITYESVPRL